MGICNLKSQPTDNFSRFLTSIILSVAGVNRMDSILNFSESDQNNRSIFSEILKKVSIQLNKETFNIPQSGPFIACIPVVSGILEIVSTFSAILEHTNRDDVRIVVFDENFAEFELFSNWFLKVKSFHIASIFKSAISYLRNGGVLICFNRITSECNLYSKLFVFPLRLSKTAHVPLYASVAISDASLSLSSILSFNDWFYNLLLFRRFLSCKNSIVLVKSSGLISNDSILDAFYSDLFDDGNLTTLFKKFVPRGTRS